MGSTSRAKPRIFGQRTLDLVTRHERSRGPHASEAYKPGLRSCCLDRKARVHAILLAAGQERPSACKTLRPHARPRKEPAGRRLATSRRRFQGLKSCMQSSPPVPRLPFLHAVGAFRPASPARDKSTDRFPPRSRLAKSNPGSNPRPRRIACRNQAATETRAQ